MRDPKRIKPNWEKIAELHSKYPDWRMSQFLINLFNELESDPWFLEDDEFIDVLTKISDKWKTGGK